MDADMAQLEHSNNKLYTSAFRYIYIYIYIYIDWLLLQTSNKNAFIRKVQIG